MVFFHFIFKFILRSDSFQLFGKFVFFLLVWTCSSEIQYVCGFYSKTNFYRRNIKLGEMAYKKLLESFISVVAETAQFHPGASRQPSVFLQTCSPHHNQKFRRLSYTQWHTPSPPTRSPFTENFEIIYFRCTNYPAARPKNFSTFFTMFSIFSCSKWHSTRISNRVQ